MTDPTQNIVIDATPSQSLAAAPVSGPRLPAVPRKHVRQMRARYELAERSVDNNEHFARAQGGSAAMNQSGIDRETIRDRVRHEMLEADSWLFGGQRSTVTGVIGRGPWLEVRISDDMQTAKLISDEFNKWFRQRVDGPRKLRTMCWGQGPEGTGLAMVVTNMRVRGDVKLDFVPFEDEQIKQDDSARNMIDRRNYLLDGVEEDEFGNPERYFIVSRHPDEYPEDRPRPYSADYVVDVYQPTRASQGRGVSDYATSVRNGPLRRIYRRATLDAAATAAKMSYIMKSNVDRFEDGETAFEEVDALTSLPIYYGEGTVLPAGWDVMQMKAEQPTTGHGEFMRDNVAEQGRAAGQPALVSTGDASNFNFASGQLSQAEWAADIDVQRQNWETLCLDKLFRHWLFEAAIVGLIPMQYADIDNVPHDYRWTRKRHQDTNKEYSGRQKGVESGLTSRQFWMTDDGLNIDEEDESAARSFGLTLEQYRQMLAIKTFGDAAKVVLGIVTEPEPQTNEQGSENDDSDDDSPDISGNNSGEDETELAASRRTGAHSASHTGGISSVGGRLRR